MDDLRQTHGGLTIGAAAKAAGVATSTLRHYERIGLMQPAGRSQTGYRLYGAAEVERLRFVRAAQATGLSLEDVRALLDLRARAGRRCRPEVRRLLERRLGEVEARLEDLGRVRQALIDALARCGRSGTQCGVIESVERSEHAVNE